MSKLHIVANRLPYSLVKENDKYSLIESVGGLATGMKSVYTEFGGKWIGWSGINSDDLTNEESKTVDELLLDKSCVTVPLSEQEILEYYEGFSNKTVWPLFHYFTQYVDYSPENWETYKRVNQRFADRVLEVAEDGDTVWVHDYQLLLVPEMIKSVKPNVTVGFFLHIPFPSYEVFRILPWRMELLKGMLGSDLLGFHIYDYERHFLSSVRRLYGYEIAFNEIHAEDRIIKADSFPMGIDYEKFQKTSAAVMQKTIQERSDLHKELEKYFMTSPDRRLILSIDRLDYTKGIPQRLKAFRKFMERYPEFHGKVTLVMLAVPSRGNVDEYMMLKKEVDELVGNINGTYGNINYTPVWYFYRAMPFENLVELYNMSDVALITPLRDGMNLVAKEYVASRGNQTGVIVLSEMAGVSKEMGEAITINPINEDEIAEALHRALTMPLEEQKERMGYLQERIQRYSVFKWAGEFVESLEKVKKIQKEFLVKKISSSVFNEINAKYKKAKKRAIFLDYDGTLTSFHKNPQEATPNKELYDILNRLIADKKNTVTIISGRDRYTLEKWFADVPINLICEHGVWLRKHGEEWQTLTKVNNEWMPIIRPVLERFVDRTPGSFIEEKNYSLVWHYRKAEPEQSLIRANELKDELLDLVGNLNLEIMEGSKVIEVKSGGINKGIAANQFINNEQFDYLMAMGDDWTDEYMFKELPSEAITVKVGIQRTSANFKLESVGAVRKFLKSLGE
ncbi:bifunctional alpha,alpha-trehalose-phosphate synthase (UDP-forming)/trehalose-phosphatase [Carboxylicivirga sp. A043]|uniref:bifunctional alpha,alpha-trehalose-phosphate synthase (UDP-forming)/trehalose-phosphatase n=1 Tax=Carboxylicivirga litoralis TaxID=2816963 RepID=UPI0021CB996C|nr:bifunctional alpha,alpha-trehalose-phosphate synthase (UDP-forming)/trehalose-phosphatase [Carboxylicivirga sp. A043]MCU4157728.1 bifunctional alpha,alpha-trehalose-phosphate synthase (UDP-forming)/trehalose-phosphatase [Carboxylicivirga sp. A043]